MAYPGQWHATVRQASNSTTSSTLPYNTLATNSTPPPIATVAQPTAPLFGTSTINPALETTKMASNSPTMTATSSLYTPQMIKPVNLKSGFTISNPDVKTVNQRPKLKSTILTPEYLNEEELLEILVSDLLKESMHQESDIRARADLVARAQAVSLELWKVSSAKVQVSGHCRDELEVFDFVPSQIAEFNSEQAQVFQGILSKIHELNVSGAADSLFSQTANEIAISRLIHHYYLSTNIQALRSSFARLTLAIANSNGVSLQTIEVLRGLTYFVGLCLLKLPQDLVAAKPSQKASSPDSLSLDILAGPPPSSSLPSDFASPKFEDDSLSSFLLQNILQAQAVQWACTLLQPSMDDVLIRNWLASSLNHIHLSRMNEQEMIKLVSQVPWYHLANMSPVTPQMDLNLASSFASHQKAPPNMNPDHPGFSDSMKRGVLVPLQQAITAAASKNFVAAIVLFSKILALASRTSPSTLTATCIGICTRSPWPAKMVCVPSLQLYDWASLDASTLCLLFGELYHLFQRKPADYASNSVTRQMKLEHRDQFANFIVSNQPMMAVTYQIDSGLLRSNFQRSYPIFFILAQIGVAALKLQPNSQPDLLLSSSLGVNNSNSSGSLSFDLPRLIAEELFHFAAAWVPAATSPNYQYQLGALRLVKAEAHDALQRLCQEDPRLYSHVMLELLQDMSSPNFDLSTGMIQLQPQLMLIDDNLVNSIAFLLCRRSFDPLPPANSPNYRTALSTMAENIFSDGPRSTDKLGWPVATYLCGNLLWHTALPVHRIKMIMLLISLKQVTGAPDDARQWILSMIAKLLSPGVVGSLGPIPTEILLNQLHHLPNDFAASLAIRIVIALNAVKAAATSSQTSASNTVNLLGASTSISMNQDSSMSRFSFSWLWDSFKLKTMMDQLIASLKKLPSTPVPSTLTTTARVQKTTNVSTGINQATDALNSLVSSATHALLGPNAGTSQAQPSNATRTVTTTTTPQYLNTASPYSAPVLATNRTTLTSTNVYTSFGAASPSTATNSSASTSTTALLLLQRVVYHYAHCIKHSGGQHQREVSVLFNILVDQLETFQKGSGIKVIEELFNESMGPSAALMDEAQIANRQLWLNFWVYALVPRLPAWKSSDNLARVLDAFAYTAFLSQAKFAEVTSLLPSGLKSLTGEDVNTVLSRRLPWLAYFLLWAYQPSSDSYILSKVDITHPTPTEKFKSTSLWRWFEAASSPHLHPSTAIIFWERFFWTYFEAGAQLADFDFLPARWKALIHSVLLRIGYTLAHPNQPLPTMGLSDATLLVPENNPMLMNYLYARLTTWNKSAIFTSGAYLFQPLLMPPDAPESGLLHEVHSMAPVPAIFAVAYDPYQGDGIALKPFPSFPPCDSPDALASMLPSPKSDSISLFTNECNLNLTYLHEVDKNYQVLQQATSTGGNDASNILTSYGTSAQPGLNGSGSSHITLPVLDDIEVWTVQLSTLETDMEECEKAQFKLIQSLWKTHDKTIVLEITCGPHCSGPARLNCISKTVIAGTPNGPELIKQNRTEFEQLYQAHIAALKSLSFACVLLEDLVRIVLDGTGEIKNTQSIYLFFELLPLVINQAIDDTSPLYARLLKSVILLGQESIQDRADRNQMKFFKILLEGTKRAPVVHTHAILAPAPSPRIPLIEVFTPKCFIVGEDHSVYIELLFIFTNTPHELSSDEELAILAQFGVAQTLPYLVKNHLARLFEILELAAVRPHLAQFVNLGITAILSQHAMGASNHAGMTSNDDRVPDLLGALSGSSYAGAPPSASGASHNSQPNTDIIGKVVKLVLLACPHSPMLGSWEMMRDEWLGPFVIPFVSSALPSSHGSVIASAVHLVSRVTALPSFQMKTHFEMLARFLKSLFSNATSQPLLNSKNRASFLSGFELVVARCHPNLIWPIYLNILTPFFAHNSGSDLSQGLDILCEANWTSLESHLTDQNFVVQLASLPLFHMPMVRSIFAGIDWIDYASKTGCFVSTTSTAPLAVDLLADTPPPYSPSTATSSSASSAITPSSKVTAKMIHFLNLFCKISLLFPSYINPRLRKLVVSISKQPSIWYQEEKHLFDWRQADPADFRTAFGGDSLVSTLRYLSNSQRSSDPSSDFKDNIQLLNDVCRHSGSVEAIEVCLEEIRSCLFVFCSSSTSPGALWHLPVHDNIEFVSNFMIPLAQQYHQMQAEKCTLPPSENGAPRMIYHQSSYDAVVSLLSVVKAPPREGKMRHSLRHIYRDLDVRVPFKATAAGETAMNEFNNQAINAIDVIRGLIVRFMGTLDSDLCLAVLHVAARAQPENTDALVVVWEEAMRSFFVQSTFPEQLTTAVTAITLPDSGEGGSDMLSESLMRSCIEMKCPLSMRVVLERQKQEWVNLSPERFTAKAAGCFVWVAGAVAPVNREFDLFVLWFYVLETTSHPKFVLNDSSVSELKAFLRFLNKGTAENNGFVLNTLFKLTNLLNQSVHAEMLKLAMKACRLFLQKEILAKDPRAVAKFDDISLLPPDLEEQASSIAKLYPGKQGSEIQRYASFFKEILPNMLTPLMDVPSFEIQLVRSLVPIAPYLQSFIEGIENETGTA